MVWGITCMPVEDIAVAGLLLVLLLLLVVVAAVVVVVEAVRVGLGFLL